MGILGEFTDAQEEMLQEAGFEPCWIKDVTEGDTIAMEHRINREVPTEMVVQSLTKTNAGQGIVLSHWIGVLPSGRKVHCSYGAMYPCWKQTSPKAGA